MSAAEYASIMETAHLMRSPENARRLIDDTLRDPFTGIGKPEPLANVLKGTWSRRIVGEHRLVYYVTDKEIVILQARYHY